MKEFNSGQGKIELIEHDDLYLAVHIPEVEVQKYLTTMQQFLPQADFINYLSKQKLRDNNKYHITIVNPIEYDECHDILVSKIITYNLIGLGRVTKNEDDVFFIVIESLDIENLRWQMKLPNRDLHVTLGFKNNDIHDVRKDRSTLFLSK